MYSTATFNNFGYDFSKLITLTFHFTCYKVARSIGSEFYLKGCVCCKIKILIGMKL